MVPIDGRTLAVVGGASSEGNRRSVELVEFRATAQGGSKLDATGSATRAQAASSASQQQRCPVMRSDFVAADSQLVSFNGIDVRVCCDSCAQRFSNEPEAYADPTVLPQLSGQEIGPRKIQQVYCPVYRDRVVSSLDPSVELDGRTVYFFNKSAKRRFAETPEKYPISDELFRWGGSAGTR